MIDLEERRRSVGPDEVLGLDFTVRVGEWYVDRTRIRVHRLESISKERSVLHDILGKLQEVVLIVDKIP